MSKRKIELFLFDIIVAILKIENTVKEFETADSLKHNYLAWDSVIREFEIIGEASKHLLRGNHIEPKYQKIVDFRNQITHEYFGIDEDIVWVILHKELKQFKVLIENHIKSIDSKSKTELITSFIEDNTYLDFVVNALKALEHNK